MKRCDWCGRFAPTSMEPFTFRNIYGQEVTQMHCSGCRPSAQDLARRNQAYLERQK